MRKESIISAVLAKESSMRAAVRTAPDTRKPLPKQRINDILPSHGANAIKKLEYDAWNNY